MRDKASEGWLHRCVCRREKQVQQLQEFIIPLEKSSMSSSAHFRSAGRLVATHSHRRTSSRHPRCVQETKISQVTGYELNGKKFEITSDSKKTKQPKEKTEPYQDSLQRNIIRDYFFKEQRNQILSEARSEMNMQELRSENADMSTANQTDKFILIAWNPTIRIRYENSRRAQAWLEAELENRERAQQETCFRTLQEVEELKMICRTQAESTLELRADDLSLQDLQESQSKVNQLAVQIQEFQDKVYSLNDSRELYDLETGSSSGPFHVPA